MVDRALINQSYGGRQSMLDGEAIQASFGGGQTNVVLNMKRSNTVALRAALAQSGRNVVVACIGPSTTAGQSTGAGTAQAIISWPMQTAALLQQRGINAGAGNWFGDKGRWGAGGTISGLLGGDARLTATGATDRAGADSAGGNPIAFTAAGTLTFTPQIGVTKFDIFLRNSAATGQIDATVDGGAATAVTATNATPNIKKVTIDAGALGTHALTLTWVSGTVFVIGVSGYDDTGGRREVSFYNWGISGAPSSRFLLDASNGIGNLSFTNFITPDLIIIDDWPINDWRQSVPLATSRANILTQIQQGKALGATIAITTPLWDSNTGGLSLQQDAYAAMVTDIAANEDIILIDVRASFVSYAVANGFGFYSDSVHLRPLGYQVKAQLIADFIMRAMNMPVAP